MDKSILQQYVDACALVDETAADIRRLERKKTPVSDSVRGSAPSFPYVAQTFRLYGTAEQPGDAAEIQRELELLQERRENASKIKLDVEAFLNTIPPRMQRIVRYKMFEGLTWESVADKLGRCGSGESVRKEYENFMREK